MDEQDKIRDNISEELLILELEEIRKQINHIEVLSDSAIPEFSKAFLLEDLRQYENYLIKKLAKHADIRSFKKI